MPGDVTADSAQRFCPQTFPGQATYCHCSGSVPQPCLRARQDTGFLGLGPRFAWRETEGRMEETYELKRAQEKDAGLGSVAGLTLLTTFWRRPVRMP